MRALPSNAKFNLQWAMGLWPTQINTRGTVAYPTHYRATLACLTLVVTANVY